MSVGDFTPAPQVFNFLDQDRTGTIDASELSSAFLFQYNHPVEIRVRVRVRLKLRLSFLPVQSPGRDRAP